MYRVEFRPQAAQDFEKLDTATAERVLRKLRWLAGNFDSINPETLAGPFAGLLKLRVGDYRVIYQADREKQVLTVRLLGHRREIYKQRS
jgi:mRNA interferase RelE/StbE